MIDTRFCKLLVWSIIYNNLQNKSWCGNFFCNNNLQAFGKDQPIYKTLDVMRFFFFCKNHLQGFLGVITTHLKWTVKSSNFFFPIQFTSQSLLQLNRRRFLLSNLVSLCDQQKPATFFVHIWLNSPTSHQFEESNNKSLIDLLMWIQSNFMFLVLLQQIQVKIPSQEDTQIWSRKIDLESTSKIRSRPSLQGSSSCNL